MSQNLQFFVRGAGMLRSVANRVPAEGWDQPSCCEGWTARQVAGHVSWGLETLANFAEGGAVAPEMPEAERAGDDPAATLTAAIDRAVTALDQPGALQRETPFGMPVDRFTSMMAMDSVAHAWDIADATGIDHGIDQATGAAAHAALAPMESQMRGPGRFADAIDTNSDAPLDQFIAFTGRRSVRA